VLSWYASNLETFAHLLVMTIRVSVEMLMAVDERACTGRMARGIIKHNMAATHALPRWSRQSS
jgi:hypothetical protein